MFPTTDKIKKNDLQSSTNSVLFLILSPWTTQLFNDYGQQAVTYDRGSIPG